MSNKNSENEASSSSSSVSNSEMIIYFHYNIIFQSGGRDRKSRKIPSQNLNLLDYDRIIVSFNL
jgi:hypothetical protein